MPGILSGKPRIGEAAVGFESEQTFGLEGLDNKFFQNFDATDRAAISVALLAIKSDNPNYDKANNLITAINEASAQGRTLMSTQGANAKLEEVLGVKRGLVEELSNLALGKKVSVDQSDSDSDSDMGDIPYAPELEGGKSVF